jgi:CheY-like chemotaxis protein
MARSVRAGVSRGPGIPLRLRLLREWSPIVIQARVLVVHDVPAVRNLVAHALEVEGCTAIGVEDCGTAAALAPLDPPNVIVADERAIDADPGAFQALRGRFPKAIVVALAAPMRLRRGGRPGVDCTVEKPPRDEQLLRAIHWALRLTGAEPDVLA